MSQPANYGAVKEEEGEEFYDVENMYYVKERELTLKQKCNKIILAALPILAAFIIIGGFTLYLLFDSGILGRGPHQGGGSANGGQVSNPSSRGGENPFAASKSKSSSSSSSVPSPIAKGGSAPVTTTHTTGSVPSPISKGGSAPMTTKLSACSAYEKCAKLGLIGTCCPTNEGVMLGCCN
jgi:hypothetical protein